MIIRNAPTRVDSSGDTMTERLVVRGPDETTFSDVWEELANHNAVGVKVNSGMFSWTRSATAEEKQEWIDAQTRYEAYTEKWERETLIRLKAKYESPVSNTE